MEDGHHFAQNENLPGFDNSTVKTNRVSQIPVILDYSSSSIKLDPTEIEEEDDVLLSFKKYVENSIYFSAIFCTLILAFLLKFIQRSLFLTKHFYHTISHRRHLLMQVFTI